MNKVFLVDVSLCSGCYNCQLACKDEHVDNDWRPYAAPQPNIGQFWMKLHEHVRGTLPKVKLHYIPTLCAHCGSAACMDVCEAGAVTRRDDGLVLIDPEKCTGCGLCASACPIGAIYKNDTLGICQKCTGCAHLLDDGQSPRCVAACHTGALRLVDEDAVPPEAQALAPREAKPRVFYLNIPQCFVAGALLTPDEQEMVVGARCRLTGEGVDRTAVTDGFGDFWFEGLAVGSYRLDIEKDGRLLYSAPVELAQSVNLGDLIALDAVVKTKEAHL